jgi:N-acetylneuraminate lyase
MLCTLVDYFVEHGVSGLYVCGSTGEGLLQTEEERMTVAETVVRASNGRTPVIVHVGAPATFMAERLAAHAAEIGADAVASIPPLYYIVGRKEVGAYYRRLKAAADLPLYFYNIPDLLNISLDSELARSLYEDGTIQGMKYTHHDILTFRGIVESCANGLNVLSGPDEHLLNFLVMGAHGGIGTTYNCMPKLYVDIYQAWVSGDIALAQELQYQANRIITLLAKYGMIPAVKAVMQLKGMDCGEPRGPFLPLTDDSKRSLKVELQAIGFFDDERTAQ